MSRKTQTIPCTNCNTLFEKQTRYIRKAEKRGQSNHFCSLSCSTSYQNKHHPKFIQNQFTSENRPNPIKVNDPFKFFLRKAKARNKCNLSLDDIKSQWEDQKGLCAFTQKPLNLNRGSSIFEMASLDRIDSTLPYEVGNIQFVIASLNLAKQSEPDSTFRMFLQSLR